MSAFAGGYGQPNINLEPGSGGGGGGDLVGVWLVTDAAQTQYPSITTALAAASSGDAVVVGPGDYAESFSVPAGVALRAHTRGTVTVTGAAATGTRITLGAQSRLENFFVEAPTDATVQPTHTTGASASPQTTRSRSGSTTDLRHPFLDGLSSCVA